MLALSKAQGIILIIGGAVFVLIAGGALLSRGRGRRAEAPPEIPRGMRPGPSDPDLETPLLQKLQGWGVLLVVFFVIWIPLTWLSEPSRNYDQEKALLTDSVARGKAGVQLFSEENQGGVGCVRCHGSELTGSKIVDTTTGAVINTPNLTTVCGGPWTGHPLIYSLNDIYITIEQGRNIMPSWSIRYAGAMDDQQINDIVNYIVSIQDKGQVTFKHNVCVNPDATKAAVDEFGPPPSSPTTNAAP
ncbi:MAG TPA: cytochrome c [Actinomycetota bacterium]|nr:cytochrome c [Actinomycetota bacterium]